MASLSAQPKESQLYLDFLNAPENEAAILPDFSYAGYHLGASPLPTVNRATHRYFDVTDYGAIPDDDQSDDEAILAANDAAHAHEGPVVLYFPRGEYLWGSPDRLFAQQLKITRSNFVVKGEGAQIGGTLIKQLSPFTHSPNRLNPDEKGYCFEIGPEVDLGELRHYQKKHRTPVVDIAPRGTFSITVKDASWIKTGMVVKLDAYIANNYEGAKEYYAPSHISEKYFNNVYKDKDWRRGAYELHQVIDVKGNEITFADPILLDLNKGIEEIYIAPAIFPDQSFLSEVGIEDIAFSGGYKELYFHYFGQKNTTGHMGIRFFDTINCWAQNLRLIDCNLAMKWQSSLYSTASNIDFAGVAGHFTVTCTDGSNGILLSYLRELSSAHHGFGATSSTKNIVYHRSVQVGNLEAHAGHPQGTLFDLNDGLFGMFRTGGRRPHHGRYLTYWNWNNTRFDEQPYLEPDIKGDSPEQQLDSISFDERNGDIPATFPPIISGLHGDPIQVLNPDESVMALESPGKRVEPESLFEAQLTERLDKLPDTIAKQSQNFETVKRYARIDIAEPEHDSVYPIGRPIKFVPRYPKSFDKAQIREVDLYLSRTTDDLGHKVATSTGKNQPLTWHASHPGVYVARLSLTDALGGTTLSRPIYFYVQGRHDAVTAITPKRAWLLADLLGSFRKAESDAKKEFLKNHDQNDYIRSLTQNREETKKLFQEPNSHVQSVNALIDNDDTTGLEIENNIYNTPRLLIFDLGNAYDISRVDIALGPLSNPMEQISLDIKTSNNPDAIYDYTNGLHSWKDGLRIVGGTRHHNFEEAESDRVLTYYFPETNAQFVQIMINILNPKEIREVIFYQRQEYVSNLETMKFELK